MKRRLAILVAALSCGCPPKAPDGGVLTAEPSATVEATPTATVTASATSSASIEVEGSLKGGWSLELTSASPGVDPANFDTPEKKAKAFYDHAATVEGGKLRVKQRTLAKETELDPAQAKKLEDAVLAVDWKKLAESIAADKNQVGGTVFHFKVTTGNGTFELKSVKLKDHPELKEIATLLKQAAGSP